MRIRNFLKREDGPTAVEYAVMLALIIVVVIAAISALTSTPKPEVQTATFAKDGTVDVVMTDGTKKVYVSKKKDEKLGFEKDDVKSTRVAMDGSLRVVLKDGKEEIFLLKKD